MTPDLESIRARHDEFRREDGQHGLAEAAVVLSRDVPALLREVDRLRATTRDSKLRQVRIQQTVITVGAIVADGPERWLLLAVLVLFQIAEWKIRRNP